MNKDMSRMNKQTVFGALMALIMMLSVGCGGKGLTPDLPPIQPPAQASKGSIEGYIYAPAEQGSPARSAGTVEAAANYAPLSEADVTVICGSSSIATKTNADGYYELGDVPVGVCSFSATKAGHAALNKRIEVKNNETTTFMVTTDGNILGKALLEMAADHSGTEVTIKQANTVISANTNKHGIYVIPGLANYSTGEQISIEAQSDCNYYLSASTTLQIDSNMFSPSVPDLELLQLFKYENTSSKETFSRSEILGGTLKLIYRGSESYVIKSPTVPPIMVIINTETKDSYSPSFTIPDNVWTEFTAIDSIRYFQIAFETIDYVLPGTYEMYMYLGGEAIPECVDAHVINPYPESPTHRLMLTIEPKTIVIE